MDPPQLVTRQYPPQTWGWPHLCSEVADAFGVDSVGIRLYIGDQFQVDERSTALSAAPSAGFDSLVGI